MLVDNQRCWSPNVQLRWKTWIIECPWAAWNYFIDLQKSCSLYVTIYSRSILFNDYTLNFLITVYFEFIVLFRHTLGVKLDFVIVSVLEWNQHKTNSIRTRCDLIYCTLKFTVRPGGAGNDCLNLNFRQNFP